MTPRTSLTATAGTTRRMATYTATRLLLTRILPAMALPAILLCVAAAAFGDTSAHDAVFIVLVVLVMLIPAALVFGIILWAISLRTLRQMIPPGTVLTAEFGDDWIGYQAGEMIRSRLPLAAVDKITINRKVLVAYISRQAVLMMPRELVPPEVASTIVEYHRRLRSRPAEQSPATGAQTSAQVLRTPEYVEATMVADAGMAGRVFRGLFTRSRFLILGTILAILVVWSVLSLHSMPGLPFGSPPVLATILIIGIGAMGYRLVYRRIVRLIPAGTLLRVRYLDDRVDIAYGATVSSVSLAAITRVRRTRAALNLYRARTPLLTIPLELVPDDIVVENAISRSRSS